MSNADQVASTLSASTGDGWAGDVARDFVRNVTAAVLFDATWAIGMAFAMVSVVMPSYLRELSSPKAIIGLTTSLPVLVVPLMLFSDRLLGGPNRRRNAFWTYSVSGAIFVLFGVVAMVLPEGWRWARILGFMLTIAILWGAIVLAQPVYFAILTDNCPLNRRGKLFAYRVLSIGLVGLACMALVRPWVRQFNGLQGFHVAIIIAGAIYVLSCFSIWLFRDHPDPGRPHSIDRPTARELLGHAWTSLRHLWHSPNYRIFIFFAAMTAAASSLYPFLVTYSPDVLHVGGDIQGRFQAVTFVSHVVNGLFVGVLADRFGYRVTLLVVGLAGVVAFALAQSIESIYAVMAAYGLVILMTSSMGTIFCNLSVELMPEHPTADLIAAANLFALPGSTLTPWLCGSVIDAATAANSLPGGYHVVFSVALVLALVGALGTAALVQEPRTGRVYVIKVVDRA